jgi:hypothetical protein
MNAFTEIRCRELCGLAMGTAKDEETQKYIQTHWLETAEKWGMFARRHSPLLLQVVSTNVCEAWRQKLKGTGIEKERTRVLGICDMIGHIMNQAKDIDNKAVGAARDFMTKKLSVCRTSPYPEIAKFPLPVQKMFSAELNAVAERIMSGKTPRAMDETLTCSCKWVYTFSIM